MHLITHYTLALIDESSPAHQITIHQFEAMPLKKHLVEKWNNMKFIKTGKSTYNVTVRSDQLHILLSYAMHNWQTLHYILDQIEDKNIVMSLIFANLHLSLHWETISDTICLHDFNFIISNLMHKDKTVPWDWPTITLNICNSESLDIIFANFTLPWDWDVISSIASFNTFLANLRFSDGRIVPWNRTILMHNSEFALAFTRHNFNQIYNQIIG